MNEQLFHRETITGLIQKTVNVTYVDLERRGLIPVDPTLAIDWTNLRTLVRDIDILHTTAIESRPEEIALRNIGLELLPRISSLIPGLADFPAFRGAIEHGIKTYSRHIKRNHIIPPPGSLGFQQTVEEQIEWGILDTDQLNTQANTGLKRYLRYERFLTGLTIRFFRQNGANPNFNNPAVQLAKQNLCWCIYQYNRNSPLYRTVLRYYIELFYIEINYEFQIQGINAQLNGFIGNCEEAISQECTYLHFNLENDASHLIGAHIRGFLTRKHLRPQPAMDQQALTNTLNAILGNNGLDLGTLGQQLQAAVQQVQAQQVAPRELNLVKITPFYGKDEEDPHEWIDQFEQAATANQWGNARLIAIAMGYMKGAALDWAKAATAAAANNRIVRWAHGNVGEVNTSFRPRFIAKFTPETKQNKWYHELMTI